MQQAHVFIEGRVQGVGFRHFTKVNAEEVGVYGWVKNLPDGRVEAVFAGPMDHIREMVNRCEQGPGSSRVDDIDVEVEEADEEYDTFEIRYH
ncbi:acylphosphatase [Aliifodinibius salicampi]|jgi:acylphosphatase|uniref:Acylphosphatase n=1 Tax=Fodinibius salicampi TaxID=1920655 RepID=A0ABT3PZR8_9BACT|nr:acylphosphatase [Fodinibius salicampi]MCW9713330.1 acylphosphatase [Fodinibius salicampi]